MTGSLGSVCRPSRGLPYRCLGLFAAVSCVLVAMPARGAAQDPPIAPPQADQVQPGQAPTDSQAVPPAPLPTTGQPPAPVQAQPPQQTRRGQDCEPVGYRVLSSVQVGGSRMTEMGLPEFVCADGVRVQADSAVDFEAAGRIQFIGGFRYEDADRIMTAVDADYFETQGRLNARGSVEVLSRDGASEIRGDTLNLYEGFEGPEDDQLVVSGRPAFALFYPEGEDEPDAPSDPSAAPEADAAADTTADAPADAPSPADAPTPTDAPAGGGPPEPVDAEALGAPYELTGTVLRFEGEDFVYADGGAVLVRDSLRGTADALVFARAAGILTLRGEGARLESDGSVFEGDEIELLLPNDELTAINVRGSGRLRTEDIALDAAEIRIEMEDGEMRHLVAVRRAEVPRPAAPLSPDQASAPPDVPTGPGGQPARAESDAFVLVGDSIDVVSEDGVLRTAWAVGSARAVAVTSTGGADDGTPADVPEPADAPDAVGDVPPDPIDDASSDPTEVPDDTVPSDPSADTPVADSGTGPSVDAADPDDEGLATLLAEDWIEGDTIEVVFAPATEPREEDDPAYVLDGLIATGSARSLYRSPPDDVDAEGRPVPRPPRDVWAISYMLADRIELALVGGAVDNVRSSGNVVGEYLEPIPPGPAPADSSQISGDQ